MLKYVTLYVYVHVNVCLEEAVFIHAYLNANVF